MSRPFDPIWVFRVPSAFWNQYSSGIHLLMGLIFQNVGGWGIVWWQTPAHLGGAKQVGDLRIFWLSGESHCFSRSLKKGRYHRNSWDWKEGTPFHFVQWENALRKAKEETPTENSRTCRWWLERGCRQRKGAFVSLVSENVDGCCLFSIRKDREISLDRVFEAEPSPL